MAMGGKIRVGIIGASASRGFASIAHIPALQALSEFEIAAVCTTRQETAEAAARHYGVPLAFSDPAQLAAHADVDLVSVSVKVPDHLSPVMSWHLKRRSRSSIRMDGGKRQPCSNPFGGISRWPQAAHSPAEIALAKI